MSASATRTGTAPAPDVTRGEPHAGCGELDPHIPHEPLLVGHGAGCSWHAVSVHLRANQPSRIAVVVQDSGDPDTSWNCSLMGTLGPNGVRWDQRTLGPRFDEALAVVRAGIDSLEATVAFLSWGRTMARRAQLYGICDNLTARAAQTARAITQLDLTLTACALPTATGRAVALGILADGTFTGTARQLTALVDASTE